MGGYLRKICVQHFANSAGRDISIGFGARIHEDISIGNGSGIGRNCEIPKGVTIGNDVMMGPNVYFCTQNHSTDKVDVPMRKQGFDSVKAIIIDDDVWIGANVVILPGVHIGKGSIVGAGSVVTKDIPPRVVAVGNPAMIKKDRNSK